MEGPQAHYVMWKIKLKVVVGCPNSDIIKRGKELSTSFMDSPLSLL